MDLSTKITISPDVRYRRIEGEMVLLDLESESYFGLDEVGARCWELLERHGELKVAYTSLLQEYEVDSQRLRADLLQLVSDLEQAGLVVSETREEDCNREPNAQST